MNGSLDARRRRTRRREFLADLCAGAFLCFCLAAASWLALGAW